MTTNQTTFTKIEFIPENSPEPKSSPKISKKKDNRSKHPKTLHQIVLLKFFYHVMEKADNKRQVVELIQEHTGFSQRQVYKWMWDETLRIRQRSKSQNDYFKEKNTEAFSKMMDVFTEKLSNSTTYVLDTVMLPKVGSLNLNNSELVWKIKLREMFSSTIILQQNKE